MNGGKDEEFQDGESSFHDSESSVDIFDLFNYCDGLLRQDGLLDVSRLDEYGEQEKKEINARRLREIWEHTATGCQRCAEIVEMLTEIRGSLGEDDEESFGASDVNADDSAPS